MYRTMVDSAADAPFSSIEVGTNVTFLEKVKYSSLPRKARGIVMEVLDDIVVIQGRHGGRYSRRVQDIRVI